MTAVPMETLESGKKNMTINLQRNASCGESSARLLKGVLRNISGYMQPKHTREDSKGHCYVNAHEERPVETHQVTFT